MPTNPDLNLDRLFRSVGSDVPDTSRFEFAFETRLLARLREERNASVFAWSWKLAPFFAALALAAGLWSQSTAARTDSMAVLVEQASRSATEQRLVTFLTGQP
jgi:anti-sigma factor RsiW